MKALRNFAETSVRRLWLLRNEAAFQDAGPPRKVRLLVDVSVIVRGDAGTGIQRVVRSIWSHLAALSSDQFDVLPVYASRRHGYCFAPANFLSRRQDLKLVPVGVKSGDCFLGLDLAAQFLPKWGEQVDAWRANGASVHVVVYDLLPRSRPDWFPSTTSERFATWLDSLMKRADQLLCISEEVAGELHRLVQSRVPAERRPRIGRLYLSGDVAGSVPSFGLTPAVERALEFTRANPTIVMVGTIEPRKAYDRAIAAFDLLWKSTADAPSLVIIGRAGWKTAALQDRIRQHPEFGRRLHWLQQASDEALHQAYGAARAVLITSYAEGFGLPLAEAAMHRRWTLVRDLPVFREQRLPNAIYFTDDSPAELSIQIENIIRLAGERSPKHGNLLNWPDCVERLIEEIGFAVPLAHVKPIRAAAS
jgi:glycosyltransferase involved in cell wall biosynthesis